MPTPKATFSVIAGSPSADELAAIELALANHTREELKPVVKRSVWAMPLMRTQLPQQIKFGSGRNF
ncbi:MAG: hypothetical protein NTV90_05345 [Actinobacteria bacterium]|nr:hypothetical protein [Actinomycetota bacterium]